MMIATANVVGWVAFGLLTVFLCVIGVALIQVNRRDRERLRRRRESVNAAPPQLRFKPQPLWVRVAGLGATLGAAYVGASVAGTAGLASGTALVLVPLYALTLRQRRAHRAVVIEAARERLGNMTPDEQRVLIGGLENSHGTHEMRSLRQIVEDEPRAAGRDAP